MTHVKTLITTFPPMIRRLRLAEENGGFTVQDGELMRIISLESINGQVVVDMVPAQFGAFRAAEQPQAIA